MYEIHNILKNEDKCKFNYSEIYSNFITYKLYEDELKVTGGNEFKTEYLVGLNSENLESKCLIYKEIIKNEKTN